MTPEAKDYFYEWKLLNGIDVTISVLTAEQIYKFAEDFAKLRLNYFLQTESN